MTLTFRQAGAVLALLFTNLASAEVDFAHQVLPILTEHCAECHSNGKYKGSLSIDTRDALLESESVVVGNSAESLFIEVLSAEDPDDRMPQKADPLTADKIAVLTQWINEGLV
ncbi:MAG: mono/diheme cytochrome c family protein, partial [Verrucomicrobiales bacterium]